MMNAREKITELSLKSFLNQTCELQLDVGAVPITTNTRFLEYNKYLVRCCFTVIRMLWRSNNISYILVNCLIGCISLAVMGLLHMNYYLFTDQATAVIMFGLFPIFLAFVASSVNILHRHARYLSELQYGLMSYESYHIGIVIFYIWTFQFLFLIILLSSFLIKNDVTFNQFLDCAIIFIYTSFLLSNMQVMVAVLVNGETQMVFSHYSYSFIFVGFSNWNIANCNRFFFKWNVPQYS